MKSIIFKFVNEDWDESISIGSMWYMNTTRKTCNQLVCMLQWNHTEDDWEYMKSLTQKELLYALEYAIQKNPLHVLYPN
jgi:hypothetical protein